MRHLKKWNGLILAILLVCFPLLTRSQHGGALNEPEPAKPLQKGQKLHIDDDDDNSAKDANEVHPNDQRKSAAEADRDQNRQVNLPRQPPPPADQGQNLNQQGAVRLPAQGNQDANPGGAAGAEAQRPLIRERRPPPQSAAGDHLADRSECAQDIEKYCSKVPRQSDVAVLQCLQDIGERDDSLNEPCQHLLWEFKVNLTQDERFKKAAEEFCKDYLGPNQCGKITSERGHMISCLADLKDVMADGHCKSFLTRMQTVIFTDFRLVGPFVTACRDDVKKFQCGSLEDDRANKATEPPQLIGQPGIQPQQQQQPQARIPHSQGATLDCLIRKLIESGKGDRELDPKCRHEIIRIAELQADDFHLDRPLFFACRNDRERFCSGVTAGEGRVFQCLAEHRFQSDMSRECQSTLDVRLQLMGQDYRLSKQLLNGCKQEMQQYNCDIKPNPQSPPPPEHMYLSYLILCLEDAGRRETNRFSPQCQTQLFEHRRLLMSDYRMDPEIVLTCGDDIGKLCGDRLEDGGRTLHCLMNHARNPRTTMNTPCKQAIVHLMQAADVGGDYRVDRVLYTACRGLIDSVCQKQTTSHSDVLSCLMMNVESPLMTEDCEDRLLEVQYFLARDYKLDPQLFHACKEDAATKCGDSGPWVNAEKAVVPPPPLDGHPAQQQGQNPDAKQPLAPGAERGYLVMTCLYRHLYDDDETNRPSPKCAKEVQRVMRERSVSVNLMPHIEDACLTDLAEKCSQKTGHGEEIRCLQENLDSLSKECKKVVREFTEQESLDTRLDNALFRACGPVLEQHCKDTFDKVIDKGDIMECLLKNKGVPAMNSKCRTFVNHYELISLKDYRFTYKFRQMCKADIEAHCRNEAQDKASIVGCLSEIVVRHALLNDDKQISKDCRKQLRAEYFTLETVTANLGDPKLMNLCQVDIKQHCDRAETAAQAFECLRERKQELEPPCRKYVFKKEKLEFQDNTFDMTLNRVCADEIRSLCAHEQPERVLHCLKTKLERDGVQKSFECLELVRKRKKEQAADIRLQPTLARACTDELQTVCRKAMEQIKNSDEPAEGIVVGCLREHVTAHQRGVVISAGCQVEVRRIIYESEIDPSLDPPFYKSCKKDIMSKCSQQLMAKEDHQSILECMKVNYRKGTLPNGPCKAELRRKITEELADIHLDPELNAACATDLQHYCDDVKPGDGKLLKCLLDASKSSNARLTQQCHAKLMDRESLWQSVKKDSPTFNIPGELGNVVVALYDSPVRNTLATILLVIVVVIFAIGLCCGRVTRRVRRELKNR